MSLEDDEWRRQFALAQLAELTTVRATAEKWAGGIASLVGAFAALSVLIKPADFDDLHSSVVKWVVFGLACLTGAAGVAALILANVASRAPKGAATDSWVEWRDKTIKRVPSARLLLRWSRVLAAVAVGALALAGIGSQVDRLAPQSPTKVYVLVTSAAGQARCGVLGSKGGVATVDGKPMGAAVTITVVDRC